MSSISVVLGSYNGARYIREQLTSIENQVLRPTELLVVDDGSTDETIEIVREFRRRAPFPVCVVQNPRTLGFSDNFLNGATLASSEFVAFSDQDDIWYPEKLARQRESLINAGALLSAHAVELIDAEGAMVGTSLQGIRGDMTLSPLAGDLWRYYFGFTIMFRRELLDVVSWNARGTDTYSRSAPLSHDRFVCLMAHSLGDVVEIEAPLAAYRQHDGQLYGSGTAGRTSNLSALRSRAGVADKCRALEDEQQTLRDASALRARLFGEGRPVGRVTAESLTQASQRWRLEAQRHELRTSAYGAETFLSATRRIVSAARAGVYRRDVFGARSLLKDLAVTALRFTVLRVSAGQTPT